jgi:hypothetical protein
MIAKIQKSILFVALLACFQSQAQQVSKAVADVINSGYFFPTVQNSEGNYVTMLPKRAGKKTSEQEVNKAFENIEAINLYRQILSDKIEDKNFDKVASQVFGKMTASKLQKTLTKDEMTAFIKYAKVKNEDELVDYINANPNPMNYAFLLMSHKYNALLGYIVEDKNLQRGVSYLYKITFTDKNGNERPMGYSIGLNAQQNNVILNKIKPTISKISTSDSSVICTWAFSLKSPELTGFVDASEKLNQNVGIFEGIKSHTLNSLQAELWVKSDKDGFVPTGKKTVNRTNDTLLISASIATLPEDVVNAYIVLNDEFGNTGTPSDTSHILSVDPLQVPILKNVKVEDILDGLQLTWKQLPEKPYFKGVEITRLGENSVWDTMAILSPTDTIYSDYNVKVGVHYIYNVKALYTQGYGMEQKVPAQGVGTVTKFSKPGKVTNFTATNEGRNIKLTWDYTKNDKFFGFYIYRGLSPLNMFPLVGPVKDNFYIDAAEELSGIAEYSYYVLVKDLKQQDSEPSNTIAIKPARKVTSLVPYNLKGEVVNNMIYLEWIDVKPHDDFVKGYTIRRAEGDNSTFKTLEKGLIEGAFYVDSTSNEQSSYQYQVASINLNNDTSDYTDIYTYTPYKAPVAVLTDFSTRNLTDGVEISWPSILYPNRKKYNIYKTEKETNKLVKIGSVNANEEYFIDKDVKMEKIYMYSITITDIEDREGEQAQAKMIIRN